MDQNSVDWLFSLTTRGRRAVASLIKVGLDVGVYDSATEALDDVHRTALQRGCDWAVPAAALERARIVMIMRRDYENLLERARLVDSDDPRLS